MLASLSFSFLLWEESTDGEITTKPVYFEKNVVVGSLDGYVYALDPLTGTREWRYETGNDIIDFTIFDNDLVAATTEGKITKLEKDGEKHWDVDLKEMFNVSYLYRVNSNQDSLFAATSEGIYKISKSGEVNKIYEVESPPTSLAVGSDYVIFAAGNKITRINDMGTKQWEEELPSGNFWNSDPTISESGSVVYIGALDNRLHAYHLTGGYGKWSVITGGWVESTPLLADSTVFFGSNDGNVYAVNAGNGNIRWKTQLPLAVISKPEKGVMGGVEVVFVGGTDASVYAFDMESGNTVWKGSAGGRVGSPLFYQSKIIFGSSDGSVYAYTTERACSIDSPVDGEFVGRKEVVVHGQSVSEAGSQKVYISINDLGWEEANTTENGEWKYIIDPSQRLIDGLNAISCRVVDSGGEESGTSFTTVNIIKDPSLPLDDLIVTTSTTYVVEGQEFTIYVNSKEDGSPIDRFELTFDDENYTADKNLTLTIDAAGTYAVTASKIGFNDATKTITVNYAGFNPLYIGAAVVVLLVIAWLVYVKFVKKPKTE